MKEAYDVSENHSSFSEEFSEKEITVNNSKETKVVVGDVDYNGKTIRVIIEHPVKENEAVRQEFISRLKNMYMKKLDLGSMQNNE